MNTVSRFGALATRAFWRAAAIRALRTALVIAIPYLGGSALGAIPWLTIASAAGLGAVASLVTSLAGLVESNGGQVSWWYAILERITKSFFQALAVGIGQATLFEQVDWLVILQAALIAAASSLLLGILTRLPEAPALPSPLTVVTTLEDVEVTQTAQGTTLGVPSAVVDRTT